jgi:thymidylate kinase
MVAQVSSLIIDQLFSAGKTFIIDGGYATKTAREEMARIAAKRGFRTLTIWVQTDMPTAKRRATKRSSKIAGDRYKQSLTSEQFDTLAKRFSEPLAGDDVIVVSGKHNYSAQARIVLNKMAAPGGGPELPGRSAFIS